MYQATDTTHYEYGHTQITVEVCNTTEHFAWRMIVDGKPSEWTTDYGGRILNHEGFGLVTAYWDGIKELVPFKIDHAKKV